MLADRHVYIQIYTAAKHYVCVYTHCCMMLIVLELVVSLSI